VSRFTASRRFSVFGLLDRLLNVLMPSEFLVDLNT
jgi:hypothetical protein